MANDHLIIPTLSAQQITHFWQRVSKPADDNCWEWTGCKNNKGYGKLRVNKHLIFAHRLAFLLTSTLPADHCVLHHCDNPACCNPQHLYAGTMRDNTLDMVRKGRHGTQGKVSDADVEAIRLRYKQGGVTQLQLGEEYGITQTMIGHIVRRNFRVKAG